MTVRVVLAPCAIFAAGASAQQPAQQELAEFDRLVHQRNQLYTELQTIGAQQDSTDAAETKLIQNRLDIVEGRLTDIATDHNLTIPRRPAPARRGGISGIAMAGQPGYPGGATASRRAEFN